MGFLQNNNVTAIFEPSFGNLNANSNLTFIALNLH